MKLLNVFLFGLLIFSSTLSFAQIKKDFSLFDKPIYQKQTPLPPDPDVPQDKMMVYCYYYPTFMVKQVDMGGKDPQQTSVVPYRARLYETPLLPESIECNQQKVRDERVFNDNPPEWFMGSKGGLIFFGSSEGYGIQIFNTTSLDYYSPQLIFEDNAFKLHSIEWMLNSAHPNSHDPGQDTLRLTYERSYSAPCSLLIEPKKCWTEIKQITGLTIQDVPKCKGYESLNSKNDTSVIRYDVEVILDGQSVVRIMPIAKSVECFAAE